MRKTRHGAGWKMSGPALTFVTTERTAIPLRISCQAPMLWALDATGRLNWVVSFQASTLTSMMLLISANSGAKGKEATNSVMKPNWITGEERGEREASGSGPGPGLNWTWTELVSESPSVC